MKNKETVNLVKQISAVMELGVVDYIINGDVVNLRGRDKSTVATIKTASDKTSVVNLVTSRVVNSDVGTYPGAIAIIVNVMLEEINVTEKAEQPDEAESASSLKPY